MTYQLVATSGRHRGKAWLLTDTPLVLGRASDCAVVLDDPLVSRRHCRLVQREGSVHFEDLGSRNPALVNGAPGGARVLATGDEISVGTELFILAGAEGVSASASAVDNEPETVSLAVGDRFEIEGEFAAQGQRQPAQTIHDLADVHRASTDFAGARSVEELFETLAGLLKERFQPDSLWMARVRGLDGLTFLGSGESGADPGEGAPTESLLASLRDRTGHLSHCEAEGRPVSTLVMPAALGDVSVAVIAMQREGAEATFLARDLRVAALLAQSLAPFVQALESIGGLERDNEALRIRAGESITLVGTSRAMGRVRTQIAEAAGSDLNVLVTGETGTGKELAARLLHAQSARSRGPFVPVNCAAIPRELMESQLFGHVRGAFTGADRESMGLLREAHGGTLFLDEVGDLNGESQARILRAIEYGTFRPVGAQEECYVDMRVVAATNQDLGAAMGARRFREDLYHRLNGFAIEMPSLKQRPSDIPILAQHFFDLAKGQAKRPLEGISQEALDHLESRRWPGNVRELRNCVLRAIAVATAHTSILVEHLRLPDGGVSPGTREELLSLDEAEKQHIMRIVEGCGGNVQEAAAILQIGPSTLYKKLAKYRIPS